MVWSPFLWYFDVNFFSSFSSIAGKIYHMASVKPIKPYLMFLVYSLATNVLSIYVSLNKLKHEGSIMFRRSEAQKLEKKMFFVKNLNNHKEYAFASKKSMVMTPDFFGFLTELLNSFQTSGNAFWDDKRFSSYRQNCNCNNLNKSQWCHHGKVLT